MFLIKTCCSYSCAVKGSGKVSVFMLERAALKRARRTSDVYVDGFRFWTSDIITFPFSNDIAALGQQQNYGNPMYHGLIRHLLSADRSSISQLAFPWAGTAMPCVEIDGQTYFRPEAEIGDFSRSCSDLVIIVFDREN